MLCLLKINFERDVKVYNALQEIRLEAGFPPLNCVSPSHCYCKKWDFLGLYTCELCGKQQPICYGADDDQYEVCDSCYVS
jgi:hypothetical protein